MLLQGLVPGARNEGVNVQVDHHFDLSRCKQQPAAILRSRQKLPVDRSDGLESLFRCHLTLQKLRINPNLKLL